MVFNRARIPRIPLARASFVSSSLLLKNPSLNRRDLPGSSDTDTFPQKERRRGPFLLHKTPCCAIKASVPVKATYQSDTFFM